VLRENINNAMKDAMKARNERLVGTRLKLLFLHVL